MSSLATEYVRADRVRPGVDQLRRPGKIGGPRHAVPDPAPDGVGLVSGPVGALAASAEAPGSRRGGGAGRAVGRGPMATGRRCRAEPTQRGAWSRARDRMRQEAAGSRGHAPHLRADRPRHGPQCLRRRYPAMALSGFSQPSGAGEDAEGDDAATTASSRAATMPIADRRPARRRAPGAAPGRSRSDETADVVTSGQRYKPRQHREIHGQGRLVAEKRSARASRADRSMRPGRRRSASRPT